MATIRQIVDELRRRGITVHEWPGWDGRGNADGGVGDPVRYIDVRGAVIHHTASAYGSCYADLVSSTRPDLYGGAVCNFAGNADGSLTVVASGLVWHAGAGVGPSLGRVLGAIPGIRNLMNRLTAGLEIVYPGDQPMTDEQHHSACVFAAVVADLSAEGDLECVRAHAETNGDVPGGNDKWDPGYAPGQTIDMAAFRRNAAATREDDMPTAEEIAAAVWQHPIKSNRVASAEVMLANADSFANGAIPALVKALLDEPISRADQHRGPTTLRAQLAWDDAHVDALAAGVRASLTALQAASPAGGRVDAGQIATTVRQAVTEAFQRLTVKISTEQAT